MALSICTPFINELGRETTLHGTAAFPIACYDDDITVSPVPWHWHDELEIILVTSGTLTITSGSVSYQVSKGDGMFLNTAVLHSVEDCGSGHGTLHSIVFHPEIVGGKEDSIFWQKYLTPILNDASIPSIFLDHRVAWQHTLLQSLQTAWTAQCEEKNGYEFLVREQLSNIIQLIYTHRSSTPVFTSAKTLREEERTKTMLQFIQNNFQENLEISQIAASASISVSECLRCFRHTIDQTPIQYVRQYRIQKAAELLSDPTHSISDIAHQCGFQEMSYFSKIFRNQIGCTPSEYRKRESV